MHVTVLLLVILVASETTDAVSLSTSGPVEVVEGRTDNSVTCSGIPSHLILSWQVTFPYVNSSTSYTVSSCDTNDKCTSHTEFGYTATRMSTGTSLMTINPKNPTFVRFATLSCQAGAEISSILLDIVSIPHGDICRVKTVTTTIPWTVAARCENIKTYSSRNRYSCQWYRKQGLAAETPIGQPVNMATTTTNENTLTNGTFVLGSCDITASWPTDDITDNYNVIFTPQYVRRFAGSVEIRKPSPSVEGCPQYVVEGQNLNCTCGGNAGTPAGIMKWAHVNSAQLTLTYVQTSQDGERYHCQGVWNAGTVAAEAVYTIRVAYGPRNASVADPNTLDTNGLQSVTLSCSATGVNPSPTFSWTKPPSTSVIHRGQNYTFMPKVPGDDGSVFQCQAYNNISNIDKYALGTVSLNYPPTEDPVINSNNTDGNFYQGDTVTLTCTVTGGKPVSAMTLNCTGRQTDESVTSAVTFNPLSNEDNGTVCTCYTKWKQTNWYTRNVRQTLFVINPPSPPVISHPIFDYPPIAGVTPSTTLTCASTPSGWPAATYSWPENGGGLPSSSQGRGFLTFRTLKREDDGKTVRCRASNPYTANRKPVSDGTVTLQVYYVPDISLSPLEGTNKCRVTNQNRSCEVAEGQRVHFRCSSFSNPPALRYNWSKVDGAATAGADTLDIDAANHTEHNGNYSCTVTTVDLENGRPPLFSSEKITVLVKYKPGSTQLTLNEKKNVTVNENEGVKFACQTDGRPTPYMELANIETNNSVGDPLKEGNSVLEDIKTWHNKTLIASCKDAGNYRCNVKNNVGNGPLDTALLYVNCMPRTEETKPVQPPTIKYVGKPQRQSFILVAYPVPDNFTFSYLGPSADNRSNDGRAVPDNIFYMNCLSTDIIYKVICNITADNITSARERGLYAVNVSNEFGAVNLEFILSFNESMMEAQSDGPIGSAIGGGVAAAIVVIAAVVVVVFLLRRRRKDLTKTEKRRTKAMKSDKIKLSTPDQSGASSTHDEAMETDEKSHKKPTAVVSPKRKSKSRTHHGKAGAVYENVELHRPARDHNDEHPPSTSTEHSTHANQPMSSSAIRLNYSSTTDHQITSNASEDDHAHPSANTHSASPAGKKHPPSPSAHRTNDVCAKQHSFTKQSQKNPSSPSTHIEVITADYEEMEPADDTMASKKALYNDVEYMTSQGASLGLDRTQQYLLDKLSGSHLNEEFEKLLAGHQRDCNVGSMEENRSKNRFNNSILPYDANRVALLGESNDYINASRIRGYSSSKSYVAAQGPKKNTVIDFWKMVWQEKITHIAMLTNLTEGEKIKCAEYWPAYGKHIRYGSVIVTSIDIFRRANCVVRTFEIKGSGDGPCRHVSQYHFITWLDHSIPSATALVDFWRTVSTSHGNQTSHSPLLVHCSAGVGRTGTFIALDIAMDTVQDGKEISVFHIIQRMRKDRINMVQTAPQYRFVHEAILEAYTSRHARLALLAFNSFFPSDIDPNKPIDKIDHEFKLLNQMKVLLHKPSRTVASSEENLVKNRTIIFPDDSHLLYLSTFVKGRNQYINAVLMPTFYGRRGCILTQLPLQDTLIDIWRLVHGNDVAAIVSIGAEVDKTEVKCCYWPRKVGESTKFGPFTITLKSKTTPGKHLISYELSVQLKNSSESRKVSLLQYKGWTGEVPDSTQDLLQLVDLVNGRSVRDHEDEEDKEASPVIVQCLDGATKSGLFRVICDVISRMTYDHDVDVYMAVRHVQIVRTESVTTEVQYRYIYHVIQEYQRRNAVYNN